MAIGTAIVVLGILYLAVISRGFRMVCLVGVGPVRGWYLVAFD